MPAPRTLAIVDDDEAFLSAMSSFVRSLGYRAETFGSSEEFLASGTLDSIDCLVTDIQMAGIDGFALQRRVRELRPELPVIMMTAVIASGFEDKAFSQGASRFWRKPVSGNEIATSLSEIFS